MGDILGQEGFGGGPFDFDLLGNVRGVQAEGFKGGFLLLLRCLELLLSACRLRFEHYSENETNSNQFNKRVPTAPSTTPKHFVSSFCDLTIDSSVEFSCFRSF